MRKTAVTLLMVALLLAPCGCVFSIGGSGSRCPPAPEEGKTSTSSSTIVEIDAAGDLESEASRLEIYKALAQRSGLTSAERAHLVEAVGDHLNSDQDRAEVLLLLAGN